MKTAEKLANSKAVRILFAILLVVGLAPAVASQPQKAYAADSYWVGQTFSGSCYIGNYWMSGSQSYFPVSGWTGELSDVGTVTLHCLDHTAANPYPQTAPYTATVTSVNTQTGAVTMSVRITPAGVTTGQVDGGGLLIGYQHVGGSVTVYRTFTGNLELDKDSSNPAITDGNSCYTLAGAQYGVYSSWNDANNRSNATAVLTTNGDGWARVEGLTQGTYWVREISPSSGYALDEQIYETYVASGQTAYVNGGKVYDKPQNDPAAMFVGKIDLETTQNMPQGSASLAGAQFTIRYYDGQYPSEEAAEASGAPTRTWVVQTNENGYASLIDSYVVSGDELFYSSEGSPTVPLGTLLIQETRAPEGYVLPDPAEVYVRNVTAEGAVESVTTFNAPTQPEKVVRGGVSIQKIDAETGDNAPQGAATVDGAVFRIFNRSDNAVEVDGKTYEPGEPIMTITTVDGIAATRTDALPYGHYSVEEVVAPDGYLGTSVVKEFDIVSNGDYAELHYGDGIKDLVKRGDLELVKRNQSTGAVMAGVPFRITSETTGESHVIVTDQNGYASTEADWNAHSYRTNHNDDAAEGAYDSAAGIWFGESPDGGYAQVDDSRGALPYDTYTIEELPCEANEGLQLVVQTGVTITRDSYTVELGTIDDPEAGIGTTAVDAADGDHLVAASADAAVIDRVSYTGLIPGNEFTLRSEILDPSTGDLLEINGTTFSSETTFVPESANGTVEVRFDLSPVLSLLPSDGFEINGVVSEALYDDAGRLIAEHKDTTDSGQTFKIVPPSAGTEASDSLDGDKTVSADPKSSIHDEVAYSYLQEGASYRIVSAVFASNDADGIDPSDLSNALGRSEASFTAGASGSGVVGIDIVADTTGIEDGGTAVVMEWIYDAAGNLVASHADPDDASQTVAIAYPSIGTAAADASDGDQTVVDDGSRQVTVNDIVSYEGLIPGKEYQVTGTLMVKSTGEELTDGEDNPVTSTTTFTPAASSGTVQVVFTFDPSDIPTGDAVVAFETLYREGVELTAHADIDDEGQTVTVERPRMWTDASDPSDGDQAVTLDPEAAIHDQVSIQNVIDGKDYRLIGILMDKQTGLPYVQGEASEDEVSAWWDSMKSALGVDDDDWSSAMPHSIDLSQVESLLSEGVGTQVVTSSSDFSLPDSWGQVGTDFGPFDATNLSAGGEFVVYQALVNLDGSMVIAAHADIDDEGQTVSITAPEMDSTAIDAADGDKSLAEDPEGSIIETVSVAHAVPNVEYRVLAQAYVIEDEHAEPIALGQPVEKTFTLPDTWGEVEITLPVDTSSLAGKKVVITDELYRGDALISVHKAYGDADQTVDIYEPQIGTTATDGLDGDKNVVTDPVSTLKDVVEYNGLIPGKTYTLTGQLMIASSGEALLDGEGAPITSTVEFTPQTPAGEVEMAFEFDSTLLDGEQLVAFETLYRNGIEIAAHTDIDDEGQTVDVTNPELDSIAVDYYDGDKAIAEDPENNISETLSVTNAVPGVEYRVIAETTYLSADGSQTKIGQPVEQTFTLDHDHGDVTITLPVDSSILVGGSVVVTDTLYRGDAVLATHSDLLDTDQTVSVYEPEIGTTAADGLDGDKNVVTDPVSTIQDTVHLNGILVGKTYQVAGVLMVKSTGEPLLDAEGKPVTAQTEFAAEHTEQDVEMTFTFDSTLLDGEEVVVFETLYRNGIEIASHADLEDEGQTVEVTNPELDSVAVDGLDGDKLVVEEPESNVVETLSVTNAVPGVEYRVVAQLSAVDDEGNVTPLGTPVQQTFTLDHDHGDVTITLPVDSSTLAGKKIVVTDQLYREDALLSVHDDVNDADQQVDVFEPEIGTKASDPIDGDQTVVIDPETTITDIVEYSGLYAGKTYTVTLVPHVKSTGEPLIDPETGEPYSATVEFTPDKPDGSVEVSITVDTTALSTDAVVAFETLCRNGIEIAAHADIDDEGQTVQVVQPVIDTVAIDGLDGDKNVVADPDASVKDVLSYENALPEVAYTSHGILMDGSTGLPLLSGEGAEEVQTSDLETFWNELLALLNIQQAAIEPDTPLDGGEGIPGEPPESMTGEGGDEDSAEGGVVGGSAVGDIVDLVDQLATAEGEGEEDEEPGQTEMPFAASMADWEGIYKLFADHPEIAEHLSTSEVEFIADRSFGEIEADFDLDAADLAGKQAVVFQVLTKPDSEGKIWTVAIHDDLADADQTVDIVESRIGTEATDKTDGDHTLLNSETATIVDTVSYENLIPGREYLLQGVLYDKATGQPLIVGDQTITSELRFTPNQPSGSVQLEFTFDASALAGHELVAFEHLYKDGAEVAAHADIDDTAQTVKVEAPPIGDEYGKTGRDIAMLGGALLAAAAIGGGAAAYAIRRRNRMASGTDGEHDAA